MTTLPVSTRRVPVAGAIRDDRTGRCGQRAGLGKVFTANMTGNIVFLGFASAGTPGFAWPLSSPPC